MLDQAKAEIEEREIIWFLLDFDQVVNNHHSPLAPDFGMKLRLEYQLEKNQVILIGKDGDLKSKFSGLELADIFKDIDAMPMRKAEMQRDK